jgi:MYXO-CTERM domain-containing protein
MNLRAQTLLATASLVLVAAPAGAQTTSAVISPSLQQYPERYINGNDVGQSTRPQNLTPLGINYDDCVNDMVLQFRPLVTLPSGDTVQVWASQSGDCTVSGNRGNGQVATCWRLNAGLGSVILTNQEENFNVRVQDIIGGQTTVGQNPTTPVNLGIEACSSLTSYAATTFQISIMAIQPNGIDTDGTAWTYSLPVDIVGPPAPTGLSTNIGDTLLLVSWTPNTDSDTGGYDVFVDPPPGGSAVDSSGTGTLTNTTLVCPEAGTADASVSTSSEAGDNDASGDDASVDDGASAVTDASAGGACSYVTTTPANGSSLCTSTVFASASIVQDSGVTLTTISSSSSTDTTDTLSSSTSTSASTGTTTSSSTSVETGSGGTTTITCDYLVGTSCTAGQPAYTATNESVTGESNGNFTITGLTDFVRYNVTVAAVDNFGNVGPLAAQTCNEPQPVDDFFKTYRLQGGTAGGGFCSVDAVGQSANWGVALGAIGLGAIASRRRRRRGAR